MKAPGIHEGIFISRAPRLVFTTFVFYFEHYHVTMKPIFIALFFFFVTATFGQSNGPGYTIIFSGCFKNDNVSMTINKEPVFINYIISTQDTATRGNLNLVQDENKLRLNYNGIAEIKKPISFNFILHIKIKINGRVDRFNLDLRMGNIILFNYCPEDGKNSARPKLIAEQLQEPFLLM
jgi:hypothetical protein